MCRGTAIETGLQRERPKERRTESKIRALRERERAGRRHRAQGQEMGEEEGDKQQGDQTEAEKIHTYEPTQNGDRGKECEPGDPQFSKSCGTCTQTSLEC